MSGTRNKYIEAAREDVETLKTKMEEFRQNLEETADKDARMLDSAWADLKAQWHKLEAAGDTASDELRESFDSARQRFRNVLDAYTKG